MTSQSSRSKTRSRAPRSDSAASAATTSNHIACRSASNESGGSIDFKLSDLTLSTTLGTGTFGRVMLAKHQPTQQYFALKILNIPEVIRLKQVDHVRSEKAILSSVSHPFIVNMLWTHHDANSLYMLLEFVIGGELFSFLRNSGRFSSSKANFYTAEIVSALDYLHSLSIVYRDLKPENLLLDRDGHLKITDFGFSKILDDRTWTLCGTPEYLAPEIIQSKGHNRAVDWWALGILIFEMLVGYPPFFDDTPFGIYEKILAGKIEWPRHLDLVAKDLVRKLLVIDRTRRLGNMKNGARDVMRHKWFRHLDWSDVYHRKLQPPSIPVASHEGDTQNFLDYPSQDYPPPDWLDQVTEELDKPPMVPICRNPGDTRNFDSYPDQRSHPPTGGTGSQRQAQLLFHDF